MFRWLGILCYIFAIVDFASYHLGKDLTGVWWSSLAACVVGTILVKIGGGSDEAD